MSLSQFLKDYIDAINSFCDSFTLETSLDLMAVLKFSGFYLLNSLKLLLQYVITFQWLSDFYALKITIPKLITSNLSSNYTLDNPALHFFKFFEVPNVTRNLFINGLLNGLFISLPVSASQILWLRRLVVDGFPAGLAASAGMVLGQFLLIFCISFGFRFIIFPWFSFEWLHYIFGIVLILVIVFKLAHRPIIRIKISETERLKKLALLHFVLTWTEQSTLFQYLSNLSFNPEPTLFETVNSVNLSPSIFENWTYILSLFIGLIVWTAIFGWFVLMIGHILVKYLNFTYAVWVRKFHSISLILIIALALTSLPYYNIDYLVTSPLGFISQDDGMKSFQLKTTSRDLKKGKLGEYSSRISLDTDIAPYDRGRYTTSKEMELTFEDLNYQAEYIWRSRNDRLTSGSAGVVNRLIKKFLPKLKYLKLKAKREREEKLNPKPFAIDSLKHLKELWEEEELTPPPSIDEDDDDNIFHRFLTDYLADVDSSSSASFITPIPQSPSSTSSFRFKNKNFKLEAGLSNKKIKKSSKLNEPKKPDRSDKFQSFSAFQELAKYSFDRFASAEELSSDEYEQRLGKRLKVKYYSNIVYKAILEFDLTRFLDRQPKSYSLTEAEENTLFEKRLILSNYYESLRKYRNTIYSEAFQDLFLGPKSYANRVYNQQFKGTLKIVRRLFPVSLEKVLNPKQQAVFKYDQPLFKEEQNKKYITVHEELNNKLSDLSKNLSTKRRRRKPFLKETNPIPFYAGWDENSRKFLVTNYLLKKTRASRRINYLNIFKPRSQKEGRKRKKTDIIHFITWPLSKQKLEKLKYKKTQPFSVMFTAFDDPANEDQRDVFEYAESDDIDIRVIYKTLPCAVKKVDLRERDKSRTPLRPLRGGRLWRGSTPLRAKIKNILDFIPQLKRDWRDSNP